MKKINNEPLVSVIMPVYNGESFVRQAIDSILNQTYQNLELLIADDGSKDKTWQIVDSYSSDKIKTFRFKRNRGAFPRTNFLIKHAQGKYLAIMDSDDISHYDRIKTQVNFLKSNKNVIVVGSQVNIINEKSQIVGKKIVPKNSQDIYCQYGLVHPMVHPSCMINKNLVPKRANLYRTKYKVNSDYYTFMELLQFGKFANLDETLLDYRIHSNNSSLKNLKKCFINTLGVRWEAIIKYNYKISLFNVLITLLEIPVILLLPIKLIDYLYPLARGLKINRNEQDQKIITSPDFSFN